MCGVVGSERKIKRVWDTSQQAKYNVFSEKGTLFLCLLFSFIIGKDRKGMERKRGLLLTKHFRIDGGIKAQYLLQFGIEERVQSGECGGKNRLHGLLCGI